MPGTAQKEAAAEALALLAQQGDKEAAGLLWEKVYKLYYMKAAKIYQKRREQFIRCGVELEDITAQTIPHDFERNLRIHKCYLVRRK